jgi:EAL domain-containing protein (putative c-di-GMP-specific phosphodiesterase class I)
VQGYLFSGPLQGDAFMAFLADEEPYPEVAVAAL